MSQVERSLKEIEKRKRKSEKPTGVILRGDYISAGLDAFGILPFVGEVYRKKT